MKRTPPRSTLIPNTTLFRSDFFGNPVPQPFQENPGVDAQHRGVQLVKRPAVTPSLDEVDFGGDKVDEQRVLGQDFACRRRERLGGQLFSQGNAGALNQASKVL